MDNNNSLPDDLNALCGSLLLGGFILGLLKLLLLAYIVFAAVFGQVLCWLLKESGIMLLHTYNLTRRLLS